MATNNSIKITDLKSEGKYIAVKQMFNVIHLVYLPDEQERKDVNSVFLITLDERLYIQEMNEFMFPKFSDIYIGKIYNDNKGDFVVQGNITLVDPKPGQFKNTDFKVKNYAKYEYRESHKTTNGTVYNLDIQDITITAVSRRKEIVHVIGYRVSTNDEVYIQYNPETNKIVQETAFFTDLGITVLKEIYCNEDDEVFIVGCIEAEKGNLGFFSKLILNTFNPIQDKKS